MSSRNLTGQRFGEFFEALHGFTPYPWQQRLATSVIETGRWPGVLALPTGSGKTAALSVATFALAVDAHRPPAQRTCPRRILMIVDRRVVVDQSAVHAELIAERLASEGRRGILAEVADALCSLHGEADPIGVATLRGGIPRDDAWARTPDQPLLAVSTVDQVGSRLLFRGYGVSQGMRPVHAGLLGNDALLLLDEVHLSRPFARTLSDLESVHGDARLCELPRRWQVVHMSATTGSEVAREDPFELSGDDRAHHVLRPRLEARRTVSLTKPVRVAARGGEQRAAEAIGTRAADEVRALLASGRRRVGVIVNRVAAALAARACLSDLEPAADIELLTGRMRALDKDAVVERLMGRVGAGVDHDSQAKPIVVVATQCLEAGADLDFDAMVTECASADALVQRLGRLNRRGQLPDAPAVILVRSDQCGGKARTDPIYGDALGNTWEALESLAVDGPELLAELLSDESRLAPAADAPALMAAHLDAWARTSPAPVPDPQPALWLHGPDVSPPGVRMVWRSDLPAELPEETSPAWLGELLGACPPSSLEAMEVPLWAARQFLDGSGLGAAHLADVERWDAEKEAGARTDPEGEPRCVVVWDGGEARITTSSQLRPGDTLVLPATYGGLRWACWDPTAVKPVQDLGDVANWRHRGRPSLRIHGERLAGHEVPSLSDRDEGEDVIPEVVAWLQTLDLPADLLELRDALGLRPAGLVLTDGPHPEVVLIGPRRRVSRPTITSEEDLASFIERGVPLGLHLAHVRDRADGFAKHLGLEGNIASDVALAAWLHDVGKADPRFQVVLGGGDGAAVLAKSSVALENVEGRRRAWDASGLPRGFRHELVSLALLEAWAGLPDRAHDVDLVLHLVASHHGWCRPFAPPVLDPQAPDVSVQLGDKHLVASGWKSPGHLSHGVADRFARLQERYGWHGLAWLESIVRLADHRASEAECMA